MVSALSIIIAPIICLPTIAWLSNNQPSAAAKTGCKSKLSEIKEAGRCPNAYAIKLWPAK